MMTCVGIDPGKEGGIAIRSSGLVYALPMPDQYNKVVTLLAALQKPVMVCMEEGQAFPGQGVVSMFNYGKTNGILEGILIALEIPYVLVKPQIWQKEVLAGKSRRTSVDKKAASIEYATGRFPHISLVFGRRTKPHDGMADALCIMDYCWRKYEISDRDTAGLPD